METMGYDKYLRDSKKKGVEITIDQYKRSLYSLFEDIDKSIAKYHGVRCFEDGCISNRTYPNVFYLHICDVLNIIQNRMKNRSTEMEVKSDMLVAVSSIMKNDFESTYLRSENNDFLLCHIDFVYYCYAYVGNKSFIPIRTKTYNNCDVFESSKFFMNNEHFVMHQYGKMQEINQNGCGNISKIAYRSI